MPTPLFRLLISLIVIAWIGHPDHLDRIIVIAWIDALGRQVAVQEHNGFDGSQQAILHVTRSVLDLRDEVLEVHDARGLSGPTWSFVTDQAGNRLKTEHHTGGGPRWVLPDAAGNAIWSSVRARRRVQFPTPFEKAGSSIGTAEGPDLNEEVEEHETPPG